MKTSTVAHRVESSVAVEGQVGYAVGLHASLQGDDKRASKTFKRLIRQHGDSPRTRAAVAMEAIRQGNYFYAREVMEPVMRETHDDPWVVFTIGEVMGRFEGKFTWLVKAGELGHPLGFPRAMLYASSRFRPLILDRWVRTEVSPWQIHRRAEAALELGEYQQAYRDYGASLDWVTSSDGYNSWVEAGIAACRAGEVWAWSLDNGIVDWGAGYHPGLVRMAQAVGDEVLMGRLGVVGEEAPSDRCEAVAVEPSCETLNTVERAWAAQPQSLELTVDLVRSYQDCGRMDEAERCLKRAGRLSWSEEETKRLDELMEELMMVEGNP